MKDLKTPLKRSAKISMFFGGITKKVPDTAIDVPEIVDIIKSDKGLKLQCDKVREISDTDIKELKKKRNKIKKSMPYVTPAGIFEARHKDGLLEMSGYAPIDLDYLSDIEQTRKLIQDDPFVLLCFVSPSGEGLKLFIQVPKEPDMFSKRVKAFYEYLYITYKLDVRALDSSTCDISRACFLSYDPDVYYNPDAQVFTDVQEFPILDSKQDNTRSAKEFRELIKYILSGRSKEYIFKCMQDFEKWRESEAHYRELSYKNALEYVKSITALTPDQKRMIIPEIAENIMENMHIVSIRNDRSPEMWIYQDGIYVPNAMTYINEKCGDILGKLYDQVLADKVTEYVRIHTYMEAADFFDEEDERYVCLQNGILDIFTKELSSYTPKLRFFNKLPVHYDPDATCEATMQHFKTVLHGDDIPLMQEIYGYLLYRAYPVQRAFMFSGDGGNGKGKTLEQMHHLVGGANTVNISLQALEKDYFMKSELHKKLANLGADLGKSDIKETSTLRELTGEDVITASRKFLSTIEFKNYAKMIFAVNTFPHIDENTDGFWRRWIYIDFPVSFLYRHDYEKRKKNDTLQPHHRMADTKISEKLTQPQELSGVLNWALCGLSRLLQNRDFSYTKSYQETRLLMQKRESSAVSFLYDCIEFIEDPEWYITHDDMYAFYRKYCLKGYTRMKVEPSLRFRQILENHGLCLEFKRLVTGREKRWYYVKFNQEIYEQVMGDIEK